MRTVLALAVAANAAASLRGTDAAGNPVDNPIAPECWRVCDTEHFWHSDVCDCCKTRECATCPPCETQDTFPAGDKEIGASRLGAMWILLIYVGYGIVTFALIRSGIIYALPCLNIPILLTMQYNLVGNTLLWLLQKRTLARVKREAGSGRHTLQGGRVYHILVDAGGMALDVDMAKQDNGTELHQWYPHGGANQSFRLHAPVGTRGDTWWELEPCHAAGKRLVVAGDGRVRLGAGGQDAAQFKIDPAGGGTYRVVCKSCQNKVWDVAFCPAAYPCSTCTGCTCLGGAFLYVFSEHGKGNQRFVFQQVGVSPTGKAGAWSEKSWPSAKARNLDASSGVAQFRISDVTAGDHLDGADHWLRKDGLARTTLPPALEGRLTLAEWQRLLDDVDGATRRRCRVSTCCCLFWLLTPVVGCLFCHLKGCELRSAYQRVCADFSADHAGVHVSLTSACDSYLKMRSTECPTMLAKSDTEKDRGVFVFQVLVDAASGTKESDGCTSPRE